MSLSKLAADSSIYLAVGLPLLLMLALGTWFAIARSSQIGDRPQSAEEKLRKERENAKYRIRERAREAHYDELNETCQHNVSLQRRCPDCDYLRSIADGREGR